MISACTDIMEKDDHNIVLALSHAGTIPIVSDSMAGTKKRVSSVVFLNMNTKIETLNCLKLFGRALDFSMIVIN